MDLMAMMGKMKETQQKIEDTKKLLDTVFVEEQSSDGLFKISISANNVIKNVSIDDALLQDKEQLEDYVITIINKAIEKATKENLTQLDKVTKLDIPMIPGMEDMFK